MKKLAALTAITLALGACDTIPPDAYANRGSPYSLLDASSEVVNVSLNSPTAVEEVTQWVDQDHPTQAELYCLQEDPTCQQVTNVLESFGVPVQYVSAADNNLVLIYERVMAHDCENRYIDNPINPYNLNHPSFGCTVAVNQVMMIGDKRQMVSPALLDFRDAERGTQDYAAYLRPIPQDVGKFEDNAVQNNPQ